MRAAELKEVHMDPRIVGKKLELLKSRTVVRSWPIERWEARSADYVRAGEYEYDGGWKKAEGESRWPAAKTVFFRAKSAVPGGVPLESLFVAFDFELLEGLLSIDGRPYCGVDTNHRRALVPHAGTLNLEVEFFSVPEALFLEAFKKKQGVFREARFELIDRDLEAAWYDLSFAVEAGDVVQDERRRRLILAGLEEALLAVDMTLPPDRFRDEVAAARAILKGKLDRIAPDPEGGRIFMTGHSHIDTAFLWPVRETVRKCARTFSTACRLMERYPDYRFTCSQPQLYAYTSKYYPELYTEIKRWVKEGRWETAGGMWVEADCNVPSGESLIRQILYGVGFFSLEFGTRPRSCWLPDVFGYPASLPGILRSCGLNYFYTNKLHWQARNKFPYHLFQWEGIDGSRVLAHVPLLKSYYCGYVSPGELALSWEGFGEKAVYGEMMYPFGFGDGGGGPTEGQLEYAERAKRFPGLPQCRQGLNEEYFEQVEKDAPALPHWRGELYLETHRGTYTTQAATKRANRKNELRLREAEIAGVLAGCAGIHVDFGPLADAWRNLLLLQFHDILPGSSIGEVYAEAARDHSAIAEAAASVRDAALEGLASQVPNADLLVFSSRSWERSDVTLASVPRAAGPLELADGEGRVVPAQVVGENEDGAMVVFAPPAVPAMGYMAFRLRPAETEAATSLKISANRMENRFFLVELNECGEIVRLLDKRHDREVIPSGQRANQLQLFQDGPENEAAWNVHATFEKRRYEFEGPSSIEVTENGPVRGALRLVRHHRESCIEQDIVLYDAVPRIDFVTRVAWRERQVMLKAAFPVEVMADRATFEIQFGAVQRATHSNTSWEQEQFEVPAQRWADLSEAGYGVSLLNDCKYGYDVKGNVLRLTLLRGPEWPDPTADLGHHEFTYSLLPHAGDWREGDTVRRALELNSPMTCVRGAAAGGALPAGRGFVTVAGPALVETIKPAEDGDGIIMRVYEPHGGRGKVTVAGPADLAGVSACNHVEEAEGPVPFKGDRFSFDIGPFQVRTFRLHMR
jgi:alpha-mannosidase